MTAAIRGIAREIPTAETVVHILLEEIMIEIMIVTRIGLMIAIEAVLRMAATVRNTKTIAARVPVMIDLTLIPEITVAMKPIETAAITEIEETTILRDVQEIMTIIQTTEAAINPMKAEIVIREITTGVNHNTLAIGDPVTIHPETSMGTVTDGIAGIIMEAAIRTAEITTAIMARLRRVLAAATIGEAMTRENTVKKVIVGVEVDLPGILTHTGKVAAATMVIVAEMTRTFCIDNT